MWSMCVEYMWREEQKRNTAHRVMHACSVIGYLPRKNSNNNQLNNAVEGNRRAEGLDAMDPLIPHPSSLIPHD